MKVQAPSSVSAVQSASRANNTRDTLQRSMTEPQFRFETAHSAGQRKVNILPRETGGGDSQIILPFRVTNAARVWQNTTEITDANGWLIDLDTTVIDLVGKSGGRIDGIALAASMDYMVWGFLDPSASEGSRFKGFGITRYPICVYTAHTNGNKGTTSVLTLAGTNENRGFRFTVGARCIVRDGVLATSPHNQGTITAATVSSVTVALDNDALYGVNLVAAGGTLKQLDRFEPKMPDTGRIYPGSGSELAEYQFIYMGMIQTNTSSNVLYTRYKGDPYYFVGSSGHLFYAVTIAGTDTGTRQLTRYMPIGGYRGLFWITNARGAGAGVTQIYLATDVSLNAVMYSDDLGFVGDNTRQNWTIPTRATDATVFTSVTSTGAAAATGGFIIQGFVWPEW